MHQLSVFLSTEEQSFSLKGLLGRMAAVEHRAPFVTGWKWNLSNETAAHSRPQWRTNAPSSTDPRFTSHPPFNPASRRESISHTCRGYGGKIPTGEGSLPRFYSQSFQGRRFVLGFGFWPGGGVRTELKARKCVDEQQCFTVVDCLNLNRLKNKAIL